MPAVARPLCGNCKQPGHNARTCRITPAQHEPAVAPVAQITKLPEPKVVSAQLPIDQLRLRRDAENAQQAYVELDNDDAQVIVTLGHDGSARVTLARALNDQQTLELEQSTARSIELAAGRAKRALATFLLDAVVAYGEGRWSREPHPDVYGMIPIAARDGTFAGWVYRLHQPRPNGIQWQKFTPGKDSPIRIGCKPSDVHMGWWFSKSLPQPMLAPNW